jgi:hypothetical protein
MHEIPSTSHAHMACGDRLRQRRHADGVGTESRGDIRTSAGVS